MTPNLRKRMRNRSIWVNEPTLLPYNVFFLVMSRLCQAIWLKLSPTSDNFPKPFRHVFLVAISDDVTAMATSQTIPGDFAKTRPNLLSDCKSRLHQNLGSLFFSSLTQHRTRSPDQVLIGGRKYLDDGSQNGGLLSGWLAFFSGWPNAGFGPKFQQP